MVNHSYLKIPEGTTKTLASCPQLEYFVLGVDPVFAIQLSLEKKQRWLLWLVTNMNIVLILFCYWFDAMKLNFAAFL